MKERHCGKIPILCNVERGFLLCSPIKIAFVGAQHVVPE